MRLGNVAQDLSRSIDWVVVIHEVWSFMEKRAFFCTSVIKTMETKKH